MPKFQPLSKNQFEELKKIRPSRDGYLLYYPAKVHLKNNKIIDRVYIVEQSAYIKKWGLYPEQDEYKNEIKIENVVKIEESPTRLPFHLADKLYEAGESGMGYSFFVVVFNDGLEKAYLSGGAVDFINYPKGKCPNDVVEVSPHHGRDMEYEHTPPYFWCIYGGISD